VGEEAIGLLPPPEGVEDEGDLSEFDDIAKQRRRVRVCRGTDVKGSAGWMGLITA
jgi:hypothetical protein